MHAICGSASLSQAGPSKEMGSENPFPSLLLGDDDDADDGEEDALLQLTGQEEAGLLSGTKRILHAQ